MNRYLEYSEEDFIMDPHFRSWVKNPSTESEIFWNNFLQEYPHKKNQLDRARSLLESIIFDKDLLASEKEALWQRIVTKTTRKQRDGKVIFMKSFRQPGYKKMVRTLVLIFAGCALILTLVYFFQTKPRQVVETKYGEIKTVVLPDSSFVTLNANSNIKYDQNQRWTTANEREVWVNGEAYFSVKHTGDNQRFIVHVDGLDIEVLGTEFNVMRREGKVKVSLNSGKIKLTMARSREAIHMSPGDILEIASSQVTKRSGNVENLSVWKENKLVFDDTPLSDIIHQLKFIYGWEIIQIDSDLLMEKLTGEVEIKDEQKLVTTLEKAFGIKIEKKGNLISISRL